MSVFAQSEASKSERVVAEKTEPSLICVLIISKLVIQLWTICIIITTSRALHWAEGEAEEKFEVQSEVSVAGGEEGGSEGRRMVWSWHILY